MPETDIPCRCCGKPLFDYGDGDAPFCWDCGLYFRDDPAQCDEPRHPRKSLDMFCLRGLGWPLSTGGKS